MALTSHSIGQQAENACCDYLQQQGLTLLDRNFRGSRGEIDLVMKEHDTVVFIEVRFRKHQQFGGAIESLTQKKRQRVISTAELYMQQNTRLKQARIDVVAMSQTLQNDTHSVTEAEYTFDWIKNAF